MKKSILATLLSLAVTPAAFAAEYMVKIENLTAGTSFGPLLVSAHPATTVLFTAGMPASMSIQKMAEGGDISGLEADVMAAGAMSMNNPAAGILAPGKNTTAMLGNPGASNTQLSIAAMAVPSNDAFVALNNLTLPTMPGTYSYLLNAYDSGTEGNDEIRGGAMAGMPGMAGMPVAPPLETLVGTGGTGIAATAEGYVHIHRGVIGDSSLTDGVSDINSSTQRWLNPIARVTITVK